MRAAAYVAFALATASAFVASAQPAPRGSAPVVVAPSASGPTNLRAHVGTDQAARLIRGSADERIRGIQRAAAIGTPEAVALLAESIERDRDRGQQIKADTRALVTIARALARFADQERARTGLLAVVATGNPSYVGRAPSLGRGASADALEEGDPIARAELAREIAAIALARSGADRALEALYGAARSGGSGQAAALVALSIHPPQASGFFGTTGAAMPATVIRMLGHLGDLRALDVLHAAARSTEVGVRCAALVALAELGDARASLLARTAIAESDVRLRAASGEVFILLGAPERFKATAAIVADDATTTIGLRMAERVFNPEITKLVAARAFEHPDRELRTQAIRALGRSPDPNAARALVAPQLLGDPELAYHAILALARSPAPNAGALVGGLFPTRLASLAARAYVVRALVRGERVGSSDDALFRMASSRVPAERALAVFGRVALGKDDADGYLADRDPRIRRAAVAASLSRPASKSTDRAFLGRLAKEDDAITRQVLAVGLRGGDPDGLVKTSTLIDRAESGGGDAALATFALARRADETTARKVGQLLASKDPVLRAHAARGLAVSALPDATGRLAEAYAYETDIDVRRAVVAALAAREADANAPARRETLALAADLDPDGPTRQAARRAIAGVAMPFGEASQNEVAWLRITLDGGKAPGEAFVGSLVRPDGVAVPVVFDEEGYALVVGLPPGQSRLVLAPKLPTDNAGAKP